MANIVKFFLLLFALSQCWAEELVEPKTIEWQENPKIVELAEQSRFGLEPYKPTYFLPVTYGNQSFPGEETQAEDLPGLDPIEFKFQVSMRFTAWENIFGDDGRLMLAYTQVAWWQAYNRELSSPFRELNFEPEIMLDFDRIASNPFGLAEVAFAFVHQSNGSGLYFYPDGTAVNLSRSWNRLYAALIFNWGDWIVGFRPWYRIPTDLKDHPLDPVGDDNPDIIDYMGHGDVTFVYLAGKQRFTGTGRLNVATGYGYGELNWEFPIHDKLSGYVQWANGYGESLIDYDQFINRVGVGLAFTNWL